MFSRESTENFQISMNLDQFSFGLWANLTRNPRHKQVEFLDTNMMCSLAKPLALDNVGIRMLYYYDTNCGIPYESQIGPHYSFIGGILHFDLMELPEQAKRVETWVMRPLLTTDGLIKKLEYPFKSAKEITDDGQEGIIDMSLWSTQISFAIQPNCYIDASAQIMYWDSELGSWSHEGIREEEFDAGIKFYVKRLESGRIRFRSLKFAPTAIVQNTYLEFPIVDWVLEPYGLDTATLTIQGQKNQLKFLIGKGKVQVTNLTQHAIFNEPYPPSVLFKHEKAEDACIVAISQYASIFQFKKSSLNGFLSTTKCSFQFIEPNDLMNQSNETPNNGYKTLIYDMDYNIQEKVVSISYLRSDSDTDDRHHNGFAPDGPTVESIQATSTVNALLKMNMKNSDNLQNVSPYFQETVLQVLRVSRLLCFS
ncbi:hypothetical protein HDV02_000764 [Globomyces sp. JEL0801]|nr:hypothetical protein HDV02_000764 [Globomyces sp. JEL0801]